MIFCTNCGASAQEVAKFCWQCGSPVGKQAVPGSAHSAPQESIVPEIRGEEPGLVCPPGDTVAWPDGYVMRDFRTELDIKYTKEVTDTLVPYEECLLYLSPRQDIQDAPVEVLRLAVFVIVRIEEPVHELDVVKRVANMWCSERAGPKFKDAAFLGLASARKAGWLLNDGPFWERPDAHCTRLRCRLNDDARDIDRISSKEIAAGLEHIIRTQGLRDIQKLTTETAWQAATSPRF